MKEKSKLVVSCQVVTISELFRLLWFAGYLFRFHFTSETIYKYSWPEIFSGAHSYNREGCKTKPGDCIFDTL